MNQDTFERTWPEMRDQIREWWDELTEEDLDQVQGTAAEIVPLLQRRYGTSRLYTQKEFSRRLEAAKLD